MGLHKALQYHKAGANVTHTLRPCWPKTNRVHRLHGPLCVRVQLTWPKQLVLGRREPGAGTPALKGCSQRLQPPQSARPDELAEKVVNWNLTISKSV